MVRVAAKGLGGDPVQLLLHCIDRLAGREAGAVADTEDVRVYRKGFRAERAVHHHIGGLAAEARQTDEFFQGVRNLAVEAFDQRLAEVEQQDGRLLELIERAYKQAAELRQRAERGPAQADHAESPDAVDTVSGGEAVLRLP